MRESVIENYLVDKVNDLGGEVRKVRWIGRKGAPDRLVMYPLKHQQFIDGEWWRTVWIEVKASGEKCKPHQLREHARMRGMGQRVVVVDSIEAVDEITRKTDKK